ncbi:MAG: Clp protease N-terminal domain-containing protein [Rubrobacteraceae bacterium]
MIERLTRRAREAITAAQEEASSFNHDYVGTGHLLLGLLQGGGGGAARVLAASGVETEAARSRLAAIVGYGEEDTPAKPFAPPLKEALKTALQEARRLGHGQVDTEHLLLALVSESEGVAAKILADLEVDRKALRAQVWLLIRENSSGNLPKDERESR